MKAYYEALVQFNTLMSNGGSNDAIAVAATQLVENFKALEKWEQDMLLQTCNAEVMDVLL